ncbi:MAG: FAD:protein FMN transferase [Nannocystaceae bacterium]|nr:FAD:protein FMN transferase [Nannocystaceae bacterium]
MKSRALPLAALLLSACSKSPPPEPHLPPQLSAGAKPKAAPRTIDAADERTPPVRRDGTMFGTSELMGTTVSLNVFVGPDGDAVKAGFAMQDALAEMARIEGLMSEWKPDTELSGLNQRAGGAAMPVSPELFEVLELSGRIHAETGGRFDVTFHGVGHLWSFKPDSTPPSPEQIEASLPLIDGAALELDAATHTARLPKAGMKVGLGAIAKGYAVDRASTLLRARGFPNHVVEAGGDTYAAGSKGGDAWRVGVKDPETSGSLGVLSIQERAVVTSGDYMRFFEHEGRRYAHILDPATGWPIEQGKSPRSVTLLAKNAAQADAYCTAVTVMGAEAGLAFVESRADLDAVIIERDGTVRFSSGLSGIYEALPPAKPEL